MNRVRLGTAILLALVLISSIVAFLVHHETNQLLWQLNQLEQAAASDSLEAAEVPFQEFEQQWEKSEQLLTMIVWRSKLQQIDATVAHLDPMRVTDCDELLAELAESRMWIERLRYSEMPIWNTIF